MNPYEECIANFDSKSALYDEDVKIDDFCECSELVSADCAEQAWELDLKDDKCTIEESCPLYVGCVREINACLDKADKAVGGRYFDWARCDCAVTGTACLASNCLSDYWEIQLSSLRNLAEQCLDEHVFGVALLDGDIWTKITVRAEEIIGDEENDILGFRSHQDVEDEEILFYTWGDINEEDAASIFEELTNYISELIDEDCQEGESFCEHISVSYDKVKKIDAPTKRAEDTYYQATIEFSFSGSSNVVASVVAVLSALALFLF
eukprot:TRINITY_DN225_c0_g1_i15.p1 TRINITY_DN225_c0_g1~~TRINITY_DN225_c0_g1_i15.p1  ORF type:complete len:297 (-),score=60.26 TRINITY_DN225_c0_g1_i15:72-866(-)